MERVVMTVMYGVNILNVDYDVLCIQYVVQSVMY